MRYAVANVRGKVFTGNYKFSLDLLEDGCVIAKVTRPAISGGHIGEMQFKFYTEAGRGRFLDFCDSESMAEVIEALAYSR